MRAAAAIGAMLVVGAVTGCILVTGGTDGYTSPEGGTLTGVGCQTPVDCNGQPCCYVLTDGGIPSTSCQASCPAADQSCAVSSDCGDGGECLSQSCTIEGVTATVTTCGPISFCTQ